MALLVLEVETGDDPVGDAPGGEPAWGCPGDLPVEEELEAIGAAEIQVVPEGLLKELAAPESSPTGASSWLTS